MKEKPKKLKGIDVDDDLNVYRIKTEEGVKLPSKKEPTLSFNNCEELR